MVMTATLANRISLEKQKNEYDFTEVIYKSDIFYVSDYFDLEIIFVKNETKVRPTIILLEIMSRDINILKKLYVPYIENKTTWSIRHNTTTRGMINK